MKNHRIYNQVERYILGKLNPEEIDELWMAFLANPELYDVFLMELHLRYLGKMRQ